MATDTQTLETVDWAALTGAYGPAHEVPIFLRNAAADDDAQRAAALDGLFSHVWHQGTVYEVTAVAVPFIAAVAAGNGKDRGDLFELLRLVRRGAGDSEQHAGHETPETLASEEWQARVARERVWVAAAHAAVDACLPLAKATALDAAEDDFVRWQAAWLWWVLGPPTMDELRALTRSAPPFVTAGLILLGAELEPVGDGETVAVPYAALPRIAALMVESRRGLDSELVKRILAILPETAAVHPYWRRLPGAHARGPAMSLLLPVIQAGQAFAGTVVPGLIAILPGLPAGPAEIAASAGIFLVWGAGASATVADVQAMFGAVAASDGVWGTSQKDMLASYALPATREGLARLATLPAADVATLRGLAATV